MHLILDHTIKEAGVLPLDECRKVSVAKFVIKSSACDLFCKEETKLKSDHGFVKRAKTICSLQPINSFVSDLINSTEIDSKIIASKPSFSPVPYWEQRKPIFDLVHTKMSENKPPYILKNMVNAHIETYYNDYIHIFTDGSVLENGNAGSAFVIPNMKTEKQYHLGKH